jgi:hypothetical protein
MHADRIKVADVQHQSAAAALRQPGHGQPARTC